MAGASPKSDQLRALREAKAFERSAVRHKQASSPSRPVTVAPVAEKVAKAKALVTKSGVTNDAVTKNREANAKWRNGNPELSRERVRNHMRKLRAQKAK